MSTMATATAPANLLSAAAIAKMPDDVCKVTQELPGGRRKPPGESKHDGEYGLRSCSRSLWKVLVAFGLDHTTDKTESIKTFHNWVKEQRQMDAFSEIVTCFPACLDRVGDHTGNLKVPTYRTSAICMIKSGNVGNNKTDWNIYDHYGLYCLRLLEGSDWTSQGKTDAEIQEVVDRPFMVFSHILYRLREGRRTGFSQSLLDLLRRDHAHASTLVLDSLGKENTPKKKTSGKEKKNKRVRSETPEDDFDDSENTAGTSKRPKLESDEAADSGQGVMCLQRRGVSRVGETSNGERQKKEKVDVAFPFRGLQLDDVTQQRDWDTLEAAETLLLLQGGSRLRVS